ncbi:hypothetical protein QQM79_20930, partial [Marinobacteraceae bacterium S3BR75-40.1]
WSTHAGCGVDRKPTGESASNQRINGTVLFRCRSTNRPVMPALKAKAPFISEWLGANGLGGKLGGVFQLGTWPTPVNSSVNLEAYFGSFLVFSNVPSLWGCSS